MNKKIFSSLTGLVVSSMNFLPAVISPNKTMTANAQTGSEAVIFAPPSNVRRTPNGQILCSVKAVTSIYVYGYTNGWYSTSVCGDDGYIHESQIRFTNNSNSSSFKCIVTNLRSGQLAVRKSPGGASIAGLNNNNVVEYIKEAQYPWYYIRVLNGPNNRVNGVTGWVNANYLDCV